MTIYIIDTTSTHKLYYAIDTDKKKSEVEAMVEEMINDGTIKDFAQKWAGEKVVSVVKVTEDKYVKAFDQLNLAQKTWTKRAKLNEVNRIDVSKVNDDVLNEDEI